MEQEQYYVYVFVYRTGYDLRSELWQRASANGRGTLLLVTSDWMTALCKEVRQSPTGLELVRA